VNLRLAAARSITFKQCAAEYIKAMALAEREASAAMGKYPAATYAELVVEALPVASVNMSLALKILEPIRTTKTETATRLRGRIESILDWARVRGYREKTRSVGRPLGQAPGAAVEVQKVRHMPRYPMTACRCS
jgi:hypothetical protein